MGKENIVVELNRFEKIQGEGRDLLICQVRLRFQVKIFMIKVNKEKWKVL